MPKPESQGDVARLLGWWFASVTLCAGGILWAIVGVSFMVAGVLARDPGDVFIGLVAETHAIAFMWASHSAFVQSRRIGR